MAERLQSLFVALAGLAAGLLPVGPAAEHVVLPALLVMLTAVFAQRDAAHVGAVRRAKTLVAVSRGPNFVFTPVPARVLGAGSPGGEPDLRIGLLLLAAPCTDRYLAFTATARGHTGTGGGPDTVSLPKPDRAVGRRLRSLGEGPVGCSHGRGSCDRRRTGHLPGG